MVLNDEIQHNIFSMMCFGPLSESMLGNVLDHFKVKMSDDRRHSLFSKLESVSKNIRLWSLNGYKNDERKLEINKTNKIGRNDKCPCGSGKKYKQCCGK